MTTPGTKNHRGRSGFTLLELVLATAIMAALVSSATVLLRTSQSAFAMAGSEQVKLDSANATLRHLIRQLRQAEGVESITAADNNKGMLVVRMPDSSQRGWRLNGTTAEYQVGASYKPLATGVDKLIFVGYMADGQTETTVAADVQMVKCSVIVNAFHKDRELTSTVWLRSF